MNILKKSKIKEKGFIGAIGDDLPSLIPIFLGLIIFFSVFLSTYNTYKSNTSLYSLRQEAISISMTIKSEPLISDYNHFQKICNKVSTTKEWNAFITSLPINIELQNQNQIEINNITKLYNTQILTYIEDYQNPDPKRYICKDNLEKLENILNTEDITKKKIVYLYPITLQQGEYATPAKLYVIVSDK